ncbi:MAG TPA: ELWxxDGT repeat protein [Thermoanaerobaculia bacterium]|nr:ELWxxDGT repeat protein [Thermoanaerobaculia bacterium]
MLRTLSVLLTVLLLLLGGALPAGAAASLLADLSPGEVTHSEPGVGYFLATIGPKVLFVGEEPGSGGELWVSDGTPLGTEMVLDLCPGECSTSFLRLGTIRDRIAVFEAGLHGIWRSDGTRQGTFPLGPDPDNPLTPCTGPGEVVSLGNALYFQVLDSSLCTLWKTDGTREGTRQVLDRSAYGLTRAGEKLFFEEVGLWVSDGTPGNAVKVRSFPGGTLRFLGAVGPRLFFIAPEKGDELWVSDGTPAGTKRLTDFAAPRPFEGTVSIQVLDGIAYFSASDGTGVRDLWRSDGTAAGTRRVTAFGSANVFVLGLARVGERLIFIVYDGLSGPRSLWSSRGTPETSAPVACSGPCPVPEERTALVVVGDRALFAANDGLRGVELWGTDGTAAGTRIVRDLCAGNCNANPDDFQVVSGELFFMANEIGNQGIWKTDGTSQGIVFLVPRGSSGLDVVQAGPKLFFTTASGGSGGNQLWTSDGTPEGSEPVTAIQGGRSSAPSSFTPFKGRVLFLACAQGLWLTDGTAAGTVPIEKELSWMCEDGRSFTPVGDLVFFQTSTHVWRTDGTPEGTFQLTPDTFWGVGELVAFEGGAAFTTYEDTDYSFWTSDGTVAGTQPRFEWPEGFLSILASSGPDLYLISDGPGEGARLLRSNGTLAGTHEITPLSSSFSGPLLGLVRLGSSLYFLKRGGQIWRTDGTAAGTGPVPLPEAARELEPLALAEHGGELFFLALTPRSSTSLDQFLELWRTDGTAAGTSRVRVIGPGEDSFGARLVSAGGRLFFPGNDGEHGVELWESDGTEAGTRMAEDIAPGPASSRPQELAVIGNRLFFSAEDGFHGREPWVLPLTGPACQPSDTVLCLGGGRFKVEASWRDFEGRSGRGHAVPLTADTGYFWFFDPANVEVISKVLDGRGVNGHHWVFYGALSTVQYTLTVTDTQTGAARRYVNPPGRLGSVGDTNAFGPLGATGSGLSVGPEAAVFEPIVAAGMATGAKALCVPSATRLCLAGGRFAVTARWKDFDGNVGDGKAVPLAGGDTGYFWFFGEDNVEVVLKVLDGRPVNGKFWVFYGALSSVEYTLTVTDTETGAVKTYRNPAGRLGSVADTGAF